MRNIEVLPGRSQTEDEIFHVNTGFRHALRAGFSIDEIFNLTKIDR